LTVKGSIRRSTWKPQPCWQVKWSTSTGRAISAAPVSGRRRCGTTRITWSRSGRSNGEPGAHCASVFFRRCTFSFLKIAQRMVTEGTVFVARTAPAPCKDARISPLMNDERRRSRRDAPAADQIPEQTKNQHEKLPARPCPGGPDAGRPRTFFFRFFDSVLSLTGLCLFFPELKGSFI